MQLMISGTAKYYLAVILSVLFLAGCSHENLSYREIWQQEHHMTNEQMDSFYGKPSEDTEIMMALVIEGHSGNWEKIKELTSKEVSSEVFAYYHNLANAMTGCLSDSLMYYYQPFERGLFLPVNEESGQFKIAASSEAWFRIGEMTMAEHSTILGEIFSANHFGVPYLKRLAEINLINGDETAALKYLNLLEDEPGCKQWVKDRRPGTQSREFISFMEQMRRFTPKSDMVHTASRTPETLRCLIESNPANIPAREYLLCYDLLTKNLGSFMNDYAPGIKESRLYQEAILIYLASNNALTSQNTGRFNIPDSLVEEFVEYTNTFAQNGGAIAKMSKYRRTYWYYFHYATRNENRQ